MQVSWDAWTSTGGAAKCHECYLSCGSRAALLRYAVIRVCERKPDIATVTLEIHGR